jgi:hypothetical protein
LGGRDGVFGGETEQPLPSWAPEHWGLYEWYKVPNSNLNNYSTNSVDSVINGGRYYYPDSVGSGVCNLISYSQTIPLDVDSGESVFLFGGGHAATWSNAIWRVDIDTPTITNVKAETPWSVINSSRRGPGPWTWDGDPGIRKVDEGVAGVWPLYMSDGSPSTDSSKYPDGQPVSEHRNHRSFYDTVGNDFHIFPGGACPIASNPLDYLYSIPEGVSEVPRFIHAKYDFDTEEWYYDYGLLPGVEAFNYVAPATYDKRTRTFYIADYSTLYSYDVVTNTFTNRSVSLTTDASYAAQWLGLDPTRDRLLHISVDPFTPTSIDLDDFSKTTLSWSGSFTDTRGKLMYDPDGDRFLYASATVSGVDVYQIDAGYTTTVTRTLLTTSAHPESTVPPSSFSLGSLFSWLAPEMGILFWINPSTDGECSIYALKISGAY